MIAARNSASSGQPGVVGGQAHGAANLCRCSAVILRSRWWAQHRLVAAQLARCNVAARRAPRPTRQRRARDAARRRRRGRTPQQVVGLDPVVERVDQPANGGLPAGSLEERGQVRFVHSHAVHPPSATLGRACNDVIMITDETRERVAGWFAGRLPQEWQATPAQITIDREEITVRLSIPDVEWARTQTAARSRGAGRPGQGVPRGDPRQADGDRPRGRAPLRRQGVVGTAGRRGRRRAQRALDPRRRAGDDPAAPAAADGPGHPRRRRVARSRADALAWCVQLVGQHEDDWLTELRDAWRRSPTYAARAPPPDATATTSTQRAIGDVPSEL